MTNNINNYEELKYVLIGKVRDVPPIWDKSHEQHHNRYILHQHWKRIAFEVGMKEEQVKKIWRNLRQEFGKQVKRVLKAGRGSLEEANPQWPYFQGLLFLKDQFAGEINSMNNTTADVEASDTFDEYMEDEFNYEDLSDPDNSRSPSVIAEIPQLPQRENGYGPNKSNQTDYGLPDYGLPRKRKLPVEYIKKPMLELENDKADNVIRQDYHHSSAIMSSADEDIGFFNSLVPHVRQLQPRQKMLFRLRVQQQLYDLLYGPYDPSQTHTIAPSTSNQNCAVVKVMNTS